jgi:CHASE2 domain-containing sensor protein
VREQLSRPAILSVLAIVLGFNVLIETHWVDRNLPMIRRGQMAVHRFLCSLSPRSIEPKWVRTVEIDDEAHREFGTPTDRAALARLISNAVRGDALVVVLDVKLSAPPDFPEGTDDYRRREDNEKLLAAINAAARNGVPVVLPTWLKPDAEGSFSQVPNIFADSSTASSLLGPI